MDGYIGLGSNIGDPVAELRRAISGLVARGVEALSLSSLYQTEPVDTASPEWFINAVAAVRYEGTPLELLDVCRGVEIAHKRVRRERNGPRTLDIDILLLDDLVLSSTSLIVPHPRFHRRRFVLEPMVEVAPEAVHPLLGKTMRELLDECEDVSKVVRLEDAFAG